MTITATTQTTDADALAEVRALAEALMAEHLPTLDRPWRFAFDRATTRLGLCTFKTRTISVSRHYAVRCTRDEIRDTILHEIAHVIAGPRARHGYEWQVAAVRIGATPRAAAKVSVETSDLMRYQGACPAGHLSYVGRRPKRHTSCGKCSRTFSVEHLIEWAPNPSFSRG